MTSKSDVGILSLASCSSIASPFLTKLDLKDIME